MALTNPIDHVYPYLAQVKTRQLKRDAKTEILVIGGGMAGLSAAQAFHAKGCKVILVEKNFCGAGASGKSSGFITPDSEIPLHGLVEKFGAQKAKHLWEFVQSGVDLIRANIEDNVIECDYRTEDTVVLASSASDFKNRIRAEHEARYQLRYESKLYQADELSQIVGARGFYGGVRYGKTFGINGYRYLQNMKTVLQDSGVEIYEETPAISLDHHRAITPNCHIQADHIVLCTDRFIPELQKLVHEIYPIQTFLVLSAPLSDAQVKMIFPEKPFMAWDTALIYTYFRITGENRLMIGGSTLLGTYAGHAQHNNARAFNRLEKYFFDCLAPLKPQFEYIWPGLIGVSKDILPIAGRDKNDTSLYYIGAAAGLPWAAALGNYAAESIIDGRSDYDDCFSPYRAFKFGGCMQSILGDRLTFALSHVTTLGSF